MDSLSQGAFMLLFCWHQANKRDDHRRQRLLQLPMAEIHARANARRLPLLGTKDDIVMRLLSEDYPKIWFLEQRRSRERNPVPNMATC
eukprot:5267368-Amphidinium_carterae.1